MSELVSIIMPSYNSKAFISESIESVIAQTYPNWELVICDDASTDESLLIIKEFAQLYSNVIYTNNSYDKGAPGARNSALDIASGRYIAFLDSDDLWYSKKLEQQICFMRKNKAAFCFSYHDIMDEKGDFLSTCLAPREVDANKMKVSNFIPCLTAIYDREILGKVYQPNVKSRNDFALWLKILNGGTVPKAYCLPITTAKYRRNSYGISSNTLDSWRFFRYCLMEYGRCSSVGAHVYSIIYIFVTLIKKKFPRIYNIFVVKI